MTAPTHGFKIARTIFTASLLATGAVPAIGDDCHGMEERPGYYVISGGGEATSLRGSAKIPFDGKAQLLVVMPPRGNNAERVVNILIVTKYQKEGKNPKLRGIVRLSRNTLKTKNAKCGKSGSEPFKPTHAKIEEFDKALREGRSTNNNLDAFHFHWKGSSSGCMYTANEMRPYYEASGSTRYGEQQLGRNIAAGTPSADAGQPRSKTKKPWNQTGEMTANVLVHVGASTTCHTVSIPMPPTPSEPYKTVIVPEDLEDWNLFPSFLRQKSIYWK